MSNEEKSLEILKKEYLAIQKKNNLPSFDEINKDFGIEKIAENETDFLIKEVRKFIGDKLFNYMRFIESILNPVNAQMFVFSIIKLINNEDKKKISEIYKKLMKIELKFIELDLEFDEDKEADFIKESYKSWQKIKKDILKIIDKINKKKDSNFEINNDGYFG